MVAFPMPRRRAYEASGRAWPGWVGLPRLDLSRALLGGFGAERRPPRAPTVTGGATPDPDLLEGACVVSADRIQRDNAAARAAGRRRR